MSNLEKVTFQAGLLLLREVSLRAEVLLEKTRYNYFIIILENIEVVGEPPAYLDFVIFFSHQRLDLIGRARLAILKLAGRTFATKKTRRSKLLKSSNTVPKNLAKSPWFFVKGFPL